MDLALLSLIWGASFYSIRLTLDELPFTTSVAWRVTPAAVVLWFYVWLRGLPLPRDPKIWAALIMMGFLNNVIPFSLMAWGQLYIETGLTAILNATTAIWGVVLAALAFQDERVNLRKGLGVGLGFCGVALAIGLENLLHFDLRSLAQLAVVGGALAYAIAGLWARIYLSDLSAPVAAAGMLTGSSLIMIPTALWIDGPMLPNLPVTWAALGYMSLIATAGAYLLYYRVLATAGAGNALLVTLMIPPVAIVLGAALRGETLLPQAYGGFALLALGLVLIDGRCLAWIDRARRSG